MQRNNALGRSLIFLVLLLAVVILFLTAPRAGQFWWSDAPRHALNGAFLRDFFVALPLSHPFQWAVDYYRHYPALTIMFYPPMLALAEAATFGLLGVSDTNAVLTVILFCASLAAGSYCLARRWLPPASACALALLVIGLPEIARWGRQSMTDVPALSFLVWSSYLFFRYLDKPEPKLFYAAMFVFLAGLYTKQSIVFVLPVFLLTLWLKRGGELLKDKHLWIGGILFIIGLMPLVLMTAKFGQGNIQSVEHIRDATVSRTSFAGWLYYFRLLPRQVGWAPLVVAAAFLIVASRRADWRPRSPAFVFLILWFAVGYLFFSAIDLKDPRLDIFVLLPVAVFAILFFHGILAERWAAPAAFAFALCCFGYTVWAAPVPEVDGYAEAARWVADNTPPGAIVVFSGSRDGSFIFNLRALDRDRQRTVIRADKLLLKISIRRELGVQQKTVDIAGVIEMLDRFGVSYVVAERDFWTDLKAMAVFQAALDSSNFKEVDRIPITGNTPHQDKELRIYRNLGQLARPPDRPTIDLPIIGRTFKGSNESRRVSP